MLPHHSHKQCESNPVSDSKPDPEPDPVANIVTDTVANPDPDLEPDPVANTVTYTEPDPNTVVDTVVNMPLCWVGWGGVLISPSPMLAAATVSCIYTTSKH